MKRDGRKFDHKTLEAIRLMAVERVRDGEKPSSVIASYGLCRTTVYKWLAAASSSDIASGAAGVPLDQREGSTPDGLDFGLWTRLIVADLIEQKFQIRLGLSAVGALLARLGLTPQKLLQRAYQRDPEAIERWRCETFPAIARRAKAESGEVFFWDESGFRADAVHGKTWDVKGQTPVVERPGQRRSISAASAVSARGGFWSCTYEGGLDGELFITLLRQMTRNQRKPVHLVVDSLPAHKTKCVKDYVASTNGKLTLHFLPGYAPDLNPDELVWSHMKRTGVARTPLRKGESLREKVEAQLAAIKSMPKLVRSFFRAPTVAYINDC